MKPILKALIISLILFSLCTILIILNGLYIFSFVGFSNENSHYFFGFIAGCFMCNQKKLYNYLDKKISKLSLFCEHRYNFKSRGFSCGRNAYRFEEFKCTKCEKIITIKIKE